MGSTGTDIEIPGFMTLGVVASVDWNGEFHTLKRHSLLTKADMGQYFLQYVYKYEIYISYYYVQYFFIIHKVLHLLVEV